MLMSMLFAVDIMNLVWGAVLTALVVAEKALPWPRAVVWLGSAVCAAGAVMLVLRAVGA